ncbi:MAG: hypothetical protein JWR10_2452 [Rubritepida sp.]|nr:hypothetical protein [Rubritepida sp.]
MKLEDILALRPTTGTSADFHEAIRRAEVLRQELTARAAELDKTRADGLLTIDDKTILKAEQEAAASRLAVDRITALLPSIREDEAKAAGAETLAELRAEVAGVTATVNAFAEWQATEWPNIPRLVGEGRRLESAARDARSRFLAKAASIYSRQEVRDAGPLDVEIPDLTTPSPISLFAHWN